MSDETLNEIRRYLKSGREDRPRTYLAVENLKAENEALHKRNAILTRALEWYANRENWSSNTGYPKNTTVCDPDYGDPGGKARRALERARKVKA